MSREQQDDEFQQDLINLYILLLLQDYKLTRQLQRSTFQQEMGTAAIRRRQGKYRRGSLPNPRRSPWVGIYNSGFNDGLITLIGLDYVSFNALHAEFEPLYWS
jgi:hypothetical protein